MAVKVNKTTQDKFWACPSYPTCRNTKPFKPQETSTAVVEPAPKSNGKFHLTPEQVRSNALNSALAWLSMNDKADEWTFELLMSTTKNFEKYIFG